MNLAFAFDDDECRHWRQVDKFDVRALELANRHYSRQSPDSLQFMPPGRTLILLAEMWTHGGDCHAVWGACENLDPVGTPRFRCSIFRNETPWLSSDLVREATSLTLDRWRRRFDWSGSPPPDDGDQSRSRASQARSGALLSQGRMACRRRATQSRRARGAA